MNQAEKLINRILSHPETSESDGVAYELLKQYQRGSPIESLRALLSNDDDRIVGEAAWIASELPEARSLLRDVGVLLRHRSKKARFWAIDCVHLWAGSSDGDELATAAALLDDAEKAVRWKAMGFLAMASREQLMAALNHLRMTAPESPYAQEFAWLLGPEGTDPRKITGGLSGSDDRRRKIAAAAAYRIAKGDSAPLRYATSLEDPEIVQFAGDMLKRISLS
jgi:hypothetical protein